MYVKILFVFIIAVLSGFFYLHYLNPDAVTIVIAKDYAYTLPVTAFIFLSFFAGVVLAVINSLVVDTKKAISDALARRRRRKVARKDANYHRGVQALVQGDTTGARALIEKAIVSNPNDTSLVINLSDTYLKEAKPIEALRALENGVVKNPGSVGILVAIGAIALKTGDPFKAARCFEEALSSDSKNLQALTGLRDIRMKEEKWGEAASLQRRLLDIEQDERRRSKAKALLTGLIFEAAQRDVERGNFSDATGRLKEVLKHDDGFIPAHLLQGEIFFKQARSVDALRVWEKAYSQHPGAVELLLRIEEAYMSESSPQKMLEKYKAAAGAHPEDANLKVLLARFYLRLEMVDNAIEMLERLHHDGHETDYTRVLLGTACVKRGHSEKAATLFSNALGIKNDLAPPYACSCGAVDETWRPRCRACGEWNTRRINPPRK
jgi:tetratricopeptide (TPR) repeat protein